MRILVYLFYSYWAFLLVYVSAVLLGYFFFHLLWRFCIDWGRLF